MLALVLAFGAVRSAKADNETQSFELAANPQPAQIAQAKEVLDSNGIVWMRNADPRMFGTIVNVALPRPQDSGHDKNTQEHYCVIAVHRSPDGRMHTFLGPAIRGGRQDISQCEEHFQQWSSKQTDPGVRDDAGNSAPDPSAWTDVSDSDVTDYDKYANYFSETVHVYRANVNDTAYDYYLVTKTPSSKPDYYGKCDGVAGCGWINNHRHLKITSDAGFPIVSHGPTNQISSGSGSFTVGLSADGPSFNYSTEWPQPSVTTIDQTALGTSAATGQWREDFYDWEGGIGVPLTSRESFYSQQAVIFRVPAGTTSFNVIVNDSAEFRFYGELKGEWVMHNHYSPVTLDYNIPVAPPIFSASTTNLVVMPGTSGQFDVTARIPFSTSGLSWHIVNAPLWLSTTIIPNPLGGTIRFNVDPTQTAPQIGYLTINTTVPDAAPSVRDGHPLSITIQLQKTFQSSPGVLIAGGTSWGSLDATNSAEVWDPVTQKTHPTLGAMTQPRCNHTATTLMDGRVLLAGGFDNSGTATDTTEIYDPKTGTFTAGPPMSVTRALHTATLLADGTVLIAGGVDSNNNALASAERYDPVSDSFMPVPSMNKARAQHTAVTLWDGSVLNIGGTSGNANDWGYGDVDWYIPAQNNFLSIPGLNEGRYGQVSGLLASGQVFVAGGVNPIHDPVSTAEVYTVGIWGFVNTNPMDFGRKYAAGSLLGNGKFLLAGGAADKTSASLYDPATMSFSGTGSMLEQRDRPMGVLLQNTHTQVDGEFLVAGGVVENSGTTRGRALELYNPNTGRWGLAGQMSISRTNATATLTGGAQ